jgi:hypothetical protein
MTDSCERHITALLLRAGEAHHVYERDVLNGVYHEDWHGWYAQYVLEHGINDYLATPLTAEDLVRVFIAVAAEHRASGTPEHWSQFYAHALCQP